MLDPSALAPGTVVAERYRVLDVIGRGGMGTVYLVQHVSTDEKLAMKVLLSTTSRDPAALERFQREARAPARIESEHVARVIDAGTAADLGGAPFLVMEYLRGADLRRVVETRGRLPPTEVVAHLGQAAHALDKAHAIGIVHRDLKPDNLFLTQRPDGSPCIKLLDFGIAKLAQEASSIGTQTGAVLGTPAFMAPEQARGDSTQVKAAADIWALGLIAYELLAGASYWTATTTVQLLAQLLFEPMVTPSSRGSSLGSAFDAWFAICCAREPELRFRTAGEAVGALAHALGVETRRSLQPSWAPSSDPPPGYARLAHSPAPTPNLALTAIDVSMTPPPYLPPQAMTLPSAGGGLFASTWAKVAVAAVGFLFLATFCGVAAIAVRRFAGESDGPRAVSPVSPRHDGRAPPPLAPPGLGPLGVENFRVYLTQPRHKAFAISDQGNFGWRSGRFTVEDARTEAVRLCIGSGARTCRIYMVDDTLAR